MATGWSPPPATSSLSGLRTSELRTDRHATVRLWEWPQAEQDPDPAQQGHRIAQPQRAQVILGRVTILGIHHVAIQASDIAAAREFYGEVMGLTEIERPAFPFDGLWFRLGTQALHIVAQDDHVAPDRQHFAVQVDDLDATVMALEAKGVSVRKLGLTYAGAGYQAFVRDPSGNSIELNQPE